LLVSGCQSRDAAANITRDSAGIRIVENRQPVWSADEAWRLDSFPLLDVGGRESGLGPMFRLGDGRIVVALPGSHQIIVFNPDGEVATRFGRHGPGPGEFQDLSRVFPIAGGDSILVYDYMQNRISVFDDEGRHGRSGSGSPDGAAAAIEGVFADGSFLTIAPTFPSLGARGLVRQPRKVSRRTVDAPARQVAEIPGTEIFYQETPTGEVDFRRPLFGHASHLAVSRNRFVWAATDSFHIHVHAPDGRLLLLIRKAHTPRKVTASDVDPIIEQRVMAVRDEGSRPAVRRMLGRLPTSTFPALGAAPENGPALLIDDDGNLWVAEYALPGDERNIRTVFDSTGVWLGSVEFPSRFAPRHIGTDFVLGKSRDSLDLEQVQLFRLRKSR
jgi:hypothetical protein